MLIRQVALPNTIPGALYVAPMPGRTGRFADDLAQFAAIRPDALISLTPPEEIAQQSPEYAQAIEASTLPFTRWSLPTPDFGVMQDRLKFLQEAQTAAKALQEGQRLIIHCGAGIGRSGTLAVAILLALGLPMTEANARVEEAGSSPDSWSQQELLDWVVERLKQR
jgi:protein-tyrosine phosphatase